VKKWHARFVMSKTILNFAPEKPKHGSMAEWLGNGLQNRVQQFESAWNLEDGRRLAAICRFLAVKLELWMCGTLF
jgi:hypothetical protein